MLILPLCYSFNPSLCLLAPSFVPALFLRSPIKVYLSFLLSFTRFDHAHFLGQPIPGVDESPRSSPAPLPSDHSSSVVLEGSFIPSSTPMWSRDLLLFFTPLFIASTSFRPFFTLLHSTPPSFFFHPSALRSLNPSVFMAQGHQMHSSSVL